MQVATSAAIPDCTIRLEKLDQKQPYCSHGNLAGVDDFTECANYFGYGSAPGGSMIPDDLRQRLEQHDQHHLLDCNGRAQRSLERANIVARVGARIELAELRLLHAKRRTEGCVAGTQSDPGVAQSDDRRRRARYFDDVGVGAFEEARIAYLIVAGDKARGSASISPRGCFRLGRFPRRRYFNFTPRRCWNCIAASACRFRCW